MAGLIVLFQCELDHCHNYRDVRPDILEARPYGIQLASGEMTARLTGYISIPLASCCNHTSSQVLIPLAVKQEMPSVLCKASNWGFSDSLTYFVALVMVLEETRGCRQCRRISSEAASGEYRIRLSGLAGSFL
jgi:hypothetical protein